MKFSNTFSGAGLRAVACVVSLALASISQADVIRSEVTTLPLVAVNGTTVSVQTGMTSPTAAAMLPPPPTASPARVPQPSDPLLEYEQRGSITYQRSTYDSQIFLVTVPGKARPVLVSEALLQRVINSPSMTDDARVAAVESYPRTMNRMLEQIKNTHYPDNTTTYSTPFQPVVVGNPKGLHAVVEQDPLAPPYVRVAFTDKDGNVEQRSIARRRAELILADKRFQRDDLRADALARFPFALPESVRLAFATTPTNQLLRQLAEADVFPDKQLGRYLRAMMQHEAAMAVAERDAANSAGRTNVRRPAVTPRIRRTPVPIAAATQAQQATKQTPRPAAASESEAVPSDAPAASSGNSTTIIVTALLLVVVMAGLFAVLRRRP